MIEASPRRRQSELPDLAESWAWAARRASSQVAVDVVQGNSPTSRPQRVAPAGAAPARTRPPLCRLLGLRCRRDARARHAGRPGAARPAWQAPFTREVTLPVFFHWTFATGPAGDFESLARRLKPFPAPPTLGVRRCTPVPPARNCRRHRRPIGHAVDGRGIACAGARPGHARRRARGDAGRLAGRAAHAGRTRHAGAQDSTAPLAPPLYGEWHSRQHTAAAALAASAGARTEPRPARAPLGARDRAPEARSLHALELAASRPHPRGQPADEPGAALAGGLAAGARQAPRRPAGRPAAAARSTADATHPPGHADARATVAASSLPDAATDPALRRLARCSPRRGAGAVAWCAPQAERAAVDAGQARERRTRCRSRPLRALRTCWPAALGALALPSTGDNRRRAAVDRPAGERGCGGIGTAARRYGWRSAGRQRAWPGARGALASAGMLAETHLLRAGEQLSSFTQPGTSLTAALGEVVKRRLSAGTVSILVRGGHRHDGAGGSSLTVQLGRPGEGAGQHHLDGSRDDPSDTAPGAAASTPPRPSPRCRSTA